MMLVYLSHSVRNATEEHGYRAIIFEVIIELTVTIFVLALQTPR